MKLNTRLSELAVVVSLLILGFFGSEIVCAQDAMSQPSQGLSIFKVAVSADSFNPSLEDTVAFTYHLSIPAKVTVKIFDPDQELVRELLHDVFREEGVHREEWDGKDFTGTVVPNEAYFFTMTAKADSFEQVVVYDPVTFSGGEEFDLGQASFDREGGTLSYHLPQPSRVLIRIGLTKGALLRTLVDWEPRIGGEVTEYWNGKDQDDLLNIWETKFSTVITYFTLPESSVVTVGNSEVSYRAYKMGLAEPREKKDSRPFANRRKISSHFLASRLTDRTFPVLLDFPEAKLSGPSNLPSGTEQILVRVDVAPEDREILANEQFEIILFVDKVYFAEEERGYLPFTFPLELSQFPPGEHLLTLNIATFKDHFGVGSRQFSILEK